jgi:transposase
MARYRTYNPDQMLLICPDVKEMISPESPVWIIVEIINKDMLRGLETSKSEEGNAAFNPLMMTRLLVWAYSNGIHSSRKIARKAWTDVEFMYLCGMQRPDFRTICRFRKENAEFLSGMYKRLYRSAYEMGITRMGTIIIDGTYMKANASGKKGVKRISRWKEIERELEEKIAGYEKKCNEIDREEDEEFGSNNGGGLPDEYVDAKIRKEKIREVLEKLKDEDDKTKVSLTDPDARYLKKNNNGNQYTFGYNVGLTVDENQLVADLGMTNLSSDQPGLKSGIDGVEETISGEIPEGVKVLADAGYFSADNIEFLEEKKLDGYIAPSMDFKTNDFEKDWRSRDFIYDDKKDVLICKNGRELMRHTPKKPPRRNVERFKAKCNCTDCPLKSECFGNEKGRRKHVSYLSGVDLRARMTEKMLSAEAKKLYVNRKTTVEPTIGDIKENLSMRQFRIRGFAALVEMGIAALCHNIKKLAKMTNIFEWDWRYA